MSKVASLELCKELYELSGWDNNASHPAELKMWERSYSLSELGPAHEDYGNPEVKQHEVHVGDWRVVDDHRHMMTTGQEVFKWWYSEVQNLHDEAFPAYDLGYLLRKIPANFNTGDARGAFELFLKTTSREWFAGYNKPEMGRWLYDGNHGVWETPCDADNPEDAVCKLAIQLFKQGILKKGEL